MGSVAHPMRRGTLTALAVLCVACGQQRGGWVKTVAVEQVVEEPRLFDLEGRALRFTPVMQGAGYRVEVLASHGFEKLPATTFGGRVVLPFQFLLGGVPYGSVNVDSEGRLVFGAPREPWTAQKLWPNGTMQQAAQAFVDRAAAGVERSIAVLWAPWEFNVAEVSLSPERAVITWSVARPTPHSIDFEPLGACRFQAALFRDGSFELRYLEVPERDGVVGVFSDSITEWPPGVDLSEGAVRAGAAFEAFHYPALDVSPSGALSWLYESQRPDDDVALLFTDFRFDTVFASTASTGGLNPWIEGLGVSPPFDGNGQLPPQLQVAVAPVWVNQPSFNALVSDRERPYSGHGFAVGLMTHEIGHRWGVAMRATVPETGEVLPLFGGDDCNCHWSPYLHAPVVHEVGGDFTPRPYPEHSVMGGSLLDEVSPGVWRQRFMPHQAPGGFSALDLYAMGLLEPAEVPETFLLRDPEWVDSEHVRGRAQPIRIDDIIAALGPRKPGVSGAPRTLRVGVYLLHRGDRPDPDAVQRADDIVDGVADVFHEATGGRMSLVR